MFCGKCGELIITSKDTKETNSLLLCSGAAEAALIMYVLRVAGICNNNDVANYHVCIIPFVGVCHVVTHPSLQYWLAPKQCLL